MLTDLWALLVTTKAFSCAFYGYALFVVGSWMGSSWMNWKSGVLMQVEDVFCLSSRRSLNGTQL
jgi:hypothetical protein